MTPPARLGLLAVERYDLGQDARYPLRRVELARLLSRSCGELADQVLVGISQRITVRGELRQTLSDLRDDRAKLRVPIRVGLAELFRAEIDFREEAGKRAPEGFVLDVSETFLQRAEQFPVLCAGHVGDACPQVLRTDDVMRLEPHLMLECRNVTGIPVVPDRQGWAASAAARARVVAPKLFPRGLLVVVREVAEEQEREHVIAEVIRVHRSAELVRDGPERLAKLFMLVLRHGLARVGDKRKMCVQFFKNLVKQRQAVRDQQV